MPKISIPLGPQQYALDTVFAGQAEVVAYRYCQKSKRRISTDKILLPKVNFIKLFWSTPNKTTPRRVNNGAPANLLAIFFFIHSKIFLMPAAILRANIRAKILSNYQSSILKTHWVSTEISIKHECANYQQNNYDYGNKYFFLHRIKKFSSPTSTLLSASKIKIWFEPMFFSEFFLW
ncbi:MAG: hypothetical protein A2131_00645 [Candidatus Sungbacteria bacterium GWC2_49_10]|uniref:Uncharacterized protein n=1 Tax=Candidatus Sungbacteria bacterium GWC2_49_10 TaxID=1802263 RepID=A0A1G2K2R1_9BACT|nr:MAG: hypothetical protein A2131_00645 [Candidatus Sungbacteria bacterium GWC2_49_10]